MDWNDADLPDWVDDPLSRMEYDLACAMEEELAHAAEKLDSTLLLLQLLAGGNRASLSEKLNQRFENLITELSQTLADDEVVVVSERKAALGLDHALHALLHAMQFRALGRVVSQCVGRMDEGGDAILNDIHAQLLEHLQVQQSLVDTVWNVARSVVPATELQPDSVCSHLY